MKIYAIVFLLMINTIALSFSQSDTIPIGYQVTLAIPTVYTEGFIGRAFVIETEEMELSRKFKVAINVEAVEEEKYSCSLDIFLGDVRVWSSGHLSRFYISEKCVLELNEFGDLRLKGPNERVGWRSGTSGQGVQRLHILRTGNLALVNALNLIKWQSFNFPTDSILWGQRLSSQTRLTSFRVNSTLFYSFEIQYDKIALYLNLGKLKYSYWEYRPSVKLNITFVQLTSNGLEIFNGKKKFDQIKSTRPEAMRFLALENNTGNLKLYYYSEAKGKFDSSYEALNFTCDLPLACKPYGICTSSGSCSCIHLVNYEGDQHDCIKESFDGLCGKNRAEMVELEGVVSVLKNAPYPSIVAKNTCANLCLDDCTCVATQYVEDDESTSLGECFVYTIARGMKQVDERGKVVYMVKVPKGANDEHGKNHGLKKWVVVVIGLVDGLIIFLVLGGLGYYVIKKKRKNLHVTGQTH